MSSASLLLAALLAMSSMSCVVGASSTTSQQELRVLSYNVRYDSMPDNITVEETIHGLPQNLPKDPEAYYPDLGEQPWSTRRIHVANDILFSGANVYGGQELLKRQVDDLQELLGDTWSWIGVGRDDGKEAGEYSAIFYDKTAMYLPDWGTFWLTSTPFDVSKHPDAGSKRICTTAHFSFKSTSSTTNSVEDNKKMPNFTILNTHLDDQSASQRRLGASLILHRAKYEAIRTSRPVILTGDFNSPPDDDAYRIIVGQQEPVRLNTTFTDRYSWTDVETQVTANHYEDFALLDLLAQTPPHRRGGHYATFTDFASVDDFSAFERLDYIFVGGSTAGWEAKTYHVGSNLHDDGVYASDHRPVFASIVVEDHADKEDSRDEMRDLSIDKAQVSATYRLELEL